MIAEPEVLVHDFTVCIYPSCTYDCVYITSPIYTYTPCTQQDNDRFLLFASDGVWEFITSQEAVTIINDNLSKGPAHACQVLIENAAARWRDVEGDYRDDITAVVIRLPLWSQL